MKFFFAPLLCLVATSASALTIPVNDTLVENNGLEKRNPVIALGLFNELLSEAALVTRALETALCASPLRAA
ncbi:hypothetical protein P168DRAFT_322293 [Aspergillus campestris IBT 28561]|uniref:Uncharacterized protein n=1 Tax=Aspergillus campestris (strain IBT 28561) TaxID=1392248 RepID=A0A2I1CRI9_ASPC2|nr:uncharacterized protein P168DRAFT_322293 [Aspergillus campestris IBT 28561]PKY00229.1 hypothetical protein P168DRAFT_322293 [Aspergillus campestris IBT 28561]